MDIIHIIRIYLFNSAGYSEVRISRGHTCPNIDGTLIGRWRSSVSVVMLSF
jgi:hypothetical protein